MLTPVSLYTGTSVTTRTGLGANYERPAEANGFPFYSAILLILFHYVLIESIRATYINKLIMTRSGDKACSPTSLRELFKENMNLC